MELLFREVYFDIRLSVYENLVKVTGLGDRKAYIVLQKVVCLKQLNFKV